MITREKRPGENWVKFSLSVKGQSGKLKTVVIGDYLQHEDLKDLENERFSHVTKLNELGQ